MISNLVKQNFDEFYDSVMADPLLFGDYMTAQPTDPEYPDPRLYEDCGSYQNVRAKFEKLLIEYNDDDKNKEMNLVLFNDAINHLTKIYRIVRFPRGHALLVGYGGSGKQSLTRLAAFIASYKLFMIQLTRGYKQRQFRDDLRRFFEMLCDSPVLFLFTDAHVIE